MAKEPFSDFSSIPEAKPSRTYLIISLIAGLLIVITVIANGFFVGTPDNTNSSEVSKSSSSPTPAAKSKSTPTSNAKVSSVCTTVRTDITMLRTSFEQGQDTPQQVSWLLEAAASDFSKAASSFSGSKADWLDKMAELSRKVSSFIIRGVPEDGPKALDQLFANMNLVDQFCS